MSDNKELGAIAFAFGDDDDGWWWANTSWGDYPEPDRPTPTRWMPLPPVGDEGDG